MDYTASAECTDDRVAIINCCKKLVDQGYRVILLTDDIELHNYENSSRFLVFTVREIKKMLTNTESHASIGSSSKEAISTENRNIKITFSNTLNNSSLDTIPQYNHITDTVLPPLACTDTNDVTEFDTPEFISVGDLVHTNLTLKNTDNVAVQTNSSEMHVLQEKVDNFPSNNNKNELSRSRVHLKRHSSHDSKFANNTEAKKINWYKRKSKCRLSNSCSNVSESDQTDVIAMNEVSCQTNYHDSCSDIFQESIDNRHYSQKESKDSDGFVRKKYRENLDIYETASETSNVRSIVDIENIQGSSESKADYVKQIKDSKNDVIAEKHVMFEVTSSAMEDILKTKCDEWVSRFVQIIEEVTSQVLQQDPPFVLDTMPPPWTIYEATECIKRKFANDTDVVDAANKLLNVLFEIGGLRGKIKIDINPAKYMEMYSYGVYLIDALQGLLTNCEDLQIATESLSKLLSDIQDSHHNPGTEDSFNDKTLDHSANESHDAAVIHTEASDKVNRDEVDYVNGSGSETLRKCSNENSDKSTLNSSSKYILRSHKKKMLQEKEELAQNVNIIRKIDVQSAFLTSLHLIKRTVTNDVGKTKLAVDEEANENPKDVDKETNADNNTEIDKNTVSNEPKIIRNFKSCVEFENRFKNKMNLVYDSWTNKNKTYRKEMECLEDDENYYDELEDEYYGCDSDYDYDSETADAENVSEDNVLDKEIEKDLNTPVDSNNIKFKFIIQKFQHTIKDTFLSVHGFCEKCYTTLSSEGGSVEKNDIHLAETTHTYLNDLCNALTSVLTREASDSIYKIQELLKVEEFKHIEVEDGDLEGYRNFITQCLDQGRILKDSVKLIIEAASE